MIYFGILRIKLNFSFPLFHFPVHLCEKKACYFSCNKARGGTKYRRVYFCFFFYGFSLVKNLRDVNNYRYTKAAACCLRPYAFNTQVGITDWSEDSSTEVRKDILFKRSKCFSRYVFRFYCPVDFNDVVLSNSRAILQWR